jgi:putative ABC transport system permease protein
MPEDPLSVRLYRRLLKLYPAGFRENYAAAMERAFRDELQESHGVLLWLRLLADLAVSLPEQFARELAQDARHTIRLWAARPWHTAFAILALAIGIGANTGVFSVVNALLLRSLPFRDSERLATLQIFFPPLDSPRHFHDWRTQSDYLADAALWETGDVNLGGSGEWQRAHVAQTSWNFFQLLGTQPILGRAFAPGEEVEGNGWGTPGPNAVAVISYGLWQSLYAGEARALGSTIRIDGNPLAIVGVAPPGFDYPEQTVIWKPAAYSGGNFGWTTIARLKPGITWERARSEVLADGYRVWPASRRAPHSKPSTLTPLRDELAGPSKRASLLLMAGVALILLIACTNVANLLMARTADRAAELSIRSALGASRARISQQLLTECALLSLAAAFAGLAAAFATTSIAARLQPAALASQTYSLLDRRVLAFAIAVSLLSGLLFGVLPALYASRVHIFGTRSSSDVRGSRAIRDTLVAAQVMLTIVLLTASISLGRAFTAIMHLDRGFNRSGVITAGVSLEGTHVETDSGRLAYFEEVFGRLRRLPGVRSVSSTQFLPLVAKGFMGGRFSLDGRRASENSIVVPVLPDYFRAMGAGILAGREFTPADLQSTAEPAIVNDAFARQFGQPGELLGRHVDIGNSHWTIIGVVKRMDYLADGANGSEIFRLSRSPGGWPGAAVVVKVDGRAEERLATIRDTIQSVDRQVPVFGVKTMQQRMDDLFARPQFYRTAVTFFAAFALLLAIIGIYGIVSYTVARRTHEMGVRMALGATPETLRVVLLRQGLLPIVAGAIPGIALAVLSGRLLESLVEGARSVEPAAYAGAVLFIAAIAAAGIRIATRPIARLDITEILRTD